jgi:hypothetical protein
MNRYVYILVTLAMVGCGKDDSSEAPKLSPGASAVVFSGCISREADYGKTAGTEVSCTFNPKWDHYSISLKQGNSDGVFFEIFGSADSAHVLRARAMATDVSVILKEMHDPESAKFGQANEMCFVDFNFRNGAGKGSFNCPRLTNKDGKYVGVTGHFECGSLYVWGH